MAQDIGCLQHCFRRKIGNVNVLLGDIARDANDLPLARGHYGAGYQLGLQTLRREKMPKPLLYSQPAIGST